MKLYKIKKQIKYWFQKRITGFSDRELWNLDQTMAEFILPRIIRFKEIGGSSVPSDLTQQEWINILDDIIYSMEAIKNQFDDISETYNDERVSKGTNLLGKYFTHFWY